jgi:hypothetical protein
MTKARSVSTGAAAKGDLVAGTGTNTSSTLAVGTNGYAVVADSTQTTGLAYKNIVPDQTSNSGKYLTTDGTNTSWGTLSAGGYTTIASGTLSGALSLSSIPQTYQHLVLRLSNAQAASSQRHLLTLNGLSSGYRDMYGTYAATPTWTFNNNSQGCFVGTGFISGSSSSGYSTDITIWNYTFSTSGFKNISATQPAADASGSLASFYSGYVSGITNVTSLNCSNTYQGGTYTLFGVK